MRNTWQQVFFWCIIISGFTSCQHHRYAAPEFTEFHKDPYGSYIELVYKDTLHKKQNIKGEIISIEGDTLLVLETVESNLSSKQDLYVLKYIPKNRVATYEVYYAWVKTSNFHVASWAFAIGHGYYALATVPFNLLLHNILDISEAEFYSLSHKKVPWSALHTFSRFPQGIPDAERNTELKPRPKRSKTN